MHYYKRNLGDYAKKAGRLSMLQHGAYTLLMDACYDREQFPTRDQAIEWVWASSTAEVEAVEFVLSKFFVLKDGVYVQNRIQEELEDYHSKAETNKRIAIERETKRREKNTNRAKASPDDHEPPPNQEPLTKNQEPKKNRFDAKASLMALGVDEQVAEDWLRVRKVKDLPLTKTALKGVITEAGKAKLTVPQAIERAASEGWAGFKAIWLVNNAPAQQSFDPCRGAL